MNPNNNSGKKLSPQILVPMIAGIVCVLVILAVVIFVTPKKATASQLQENLNLGSKYLDAGEYDKAEVAFNDALKIDKKSTDATLGLAKVYNGKKQPEKALDMLKKTGENMKNVSTSSVKKDSAAWNSRVNDYQNAFENTKSIFKEQGKTSQVEETEKEEQDTTKYITLIINIINPTATPTPTTDPNELDDGSNNSAGGAGLDSGKVGEVTAAPHPGDQTDPTSAPDRDNTESEDGADQNAADDTDSTDDEDSTDDTDSTDASDYAEDTENPYDSSDYPEDPDSETYDNPSDEAGTTEATNEDVYGQDELPSGGSEVSNGEQNENSYDNPGEASNEDTDDNAYEDPAETSDENQDGNYSEPDTETADDPAIPTPGPAETYTETTETSQTDETGTEQTDSNTAETADDDAVLAAYVAQVEISKYTGGSISYTDSTSMASVNGVLATDQRDFNSDGRPELLVISISGGKLQFELYRAENGEAQQIASESADPGFGDPVEGITYSGTQECFVKDNGTSVDIGIAGYYSGMSGENAMPEARLAIALYTVNSDGTVSQTGNAALVNGTQLYLNGTTPQEGGKDAFISEISKMGLSGSWVAESADMLAGMDLLNNPMQDTAGVPNPINTGLSAKETGVQDLAVINVGIQPGSSSMDFSVK